MKNSKKSNHVIIAIAVAACFFLFFAAAQDKKRLERKIERIIKEREKELKELKEESMLNKLRLTFKMWEDSAKVNPVVVSKILKEPEGIKAKAILAGADEMYPDVGYDADYWSLRGYMSAAEMRGEHCPNNKAKAILHKRKMKVQRDFIDSMGKKALSVCKNSKVPPSILVAQAYLESGYGTSRLCVVANNYFGHMSHSPKEMRGVSGRIKAKDRNVAGKIKEYFFRVYESPWWSLKHHVWLLENSYAHRLPKDKSIPIRERWMSALCGCSTKMRAKESLAESKRKGGYLYAGACAWTANDGKTSRYVAELKWVIRTFSLEKLDEQWDK